METEHLGCWVSNQGAMTLLSIVKTINKIDVPTKVREIQGFVVLINYYRDMWRRHAHKLAPLTKLCYTNVKFERTDVEQKSFEDNKKIVGRGMFLSYPNFSK